MKNRSGEGIPFGKILSNLMQQRGITVRELAVMIRIPASTLFEWKNGATPTDLLAVERIASALSVDFKSLLLGRPEPINQKMPEIYFEEDYFDGIVHLNIKKIKTKLR